VTKHAPGVGLGEFLQQMFCCFCDGSSRSLRYFDQLAPEPGSAAPMQTPAERRGSSPAGKRFGPAPGLLGAGLGRRILQEVFLGRLHVEPPALIELTLDRRGMKNDQAQERAGATPPSQKGQGCPPLQWRWQGRGPTRSSGQAPCRATPGRRPANWGRTWGI
jgi:hypothetical protein